MSSASAPTLHPGPAGPREDVWVRSTCFMCWNTCGIQVHRVNGVVTRIEGDPECPQNRGRLCAKGQAALISLYNPHRVLTPLRRTNPEKGIGVDPRWEAIPWDQAMDLLVERLARVRAEDPRKLVVTTFDNMGQSGICWTAFASAFGTPNHGPRGAQYFCGNGFHPVTYLTHGTFFGEPDLTYCRYLILFGTQNGFVVNHLPMDLANRMAAARDRGMRLVVVDPVCTAAASQADEWLPIRPGTDAALALGMINLLLNDLGLYDREFLVRHTNGPYLITPDGSYARDPGSGRPLVWDEAAGEARTWDAAGDASLALEGSYEVGGRPCRTAFTCLREHVCRYTPEAVARITTLPAETVRRITTEFGRAAEIGSTIELDGHTLPHRPACASWYRGAIAHKHAMLSGLAIQFVNLVVGALDVPGGHLGVSPVCLTPPVRWAPGASDEGLLVPQGAIRRRKLPYPAWKARAPETLDLLDLLPVAPYSTTLFVENMLHPERYGVPYRPEVLINCRSNLLMTTANPETMAEVLRRVPFVVAFACEMNETAELADLVLPDTHYLERLDAFPNEAWEFVGAGQGSWYWMVRQPAVPPQGEARHWVEVLFEVARRVGFLGDIYLLLNGLLDLKPPYALDPQAVYTWEELADRWMKSLHGPEHGLEYFKAHGCLVTGPKRIEEAYPRPFLTPRIPLYLEHFQRAGHDLRQVTQKLGLDWDLSDYQPLPDWKPCPGYEPHDGYDLLAVNYKLPYHSLAYTAHNPWLSDLGEMDSRAYRVLLHTAVGLAKGIATGDRIWIESDAGFRVQGEAYLTEGVHPEVVGIAACLGQWASGKPRAWGRGVHFNTLLPNSLERIDLLSAALDACIRVKVWKS